MSTAADPLNDRLLAGQPSPIAGTPLSPPQPKSVEEMDVPRELLYNLALKLAHTVPHLTTEWAARRLCLPLSVMNDLLDELRSDQLIEPLGTSGGFGFRYSIGSKKGRERARTLMEACSYVGPAPVSLESYSRSLETQLADLPEVTAEDVSGALADLELPADAVELVGYAATSGRSLFLHGPPGNGKSSIGLLLPRALRGYLWIPHAITVDHQIIRIFDIQCHRRVAEDRLPERGVGADRRWVAVERPQVCVGGELQLEDLDLAYRESSGFYEAPLHLKANGGVFLLDDLGCQRTNSRDLLRRWILPLEHSIDYLTLRTGQKLQIPFQQMLIVSTNLDPDRVMEPAVLRRMGYRLHLPYPTPAQFAEIFRRRVASEQLELPQPLLEQILARYEREQRPLRCCDPRDLVERMRDICRFRGWKFELNERIAKLAWEGYFGRQGETAEARPLATEDHAWADEPPTAEGSR